MAQIAEQTRDVYKGAASAVGQAPDSDGDLSRGMFLAGAEALRSCYARSARLKTCPDTNLKIKFLMPSVVPNERNRSLGLQPLREAGPI